jgi:predicted molibdopterin-dependent oxidoreductase YjgC
MYIENLKTSDPNLIEEFLKDYWSIIPNNIFEGDEIVEVSIRENKNVGQKLAIVTKRRRQMSQNNTYSQYFIKSQKKECRQIWVQSEARMITNYF